MSYKTEVIADWSGEWVPNALRFPTKEMAEKYGSDLSMRWTAVREWRVVESEDPVMYYDERGTQIGPKGPELGISSRRRYKTAAQERADEMRETDVPLVDQFSPGDKVVVDRAWLRHWSFTGAPAPTKSLWKKLVTEGGAVVEATDEMFGTVWVLDRFGQMHGGAFPVPARFVHPATIGLGAARSALERDLVDHLKIDPASAHTLAAELKAAAGDHEAVDRVMDKVNQKLNAHGVEAIEGKWHDRYYMNIVLLYVNRGDTYDATLLYDTEKEKFSVGSWGDWVERHGL